MTKMKKITALVLSAVLLVTATVAATVAYLMDTTDEIENVFTVGHVLIDLEETKDDFQMIPGSEIEKDPKVSVLDGSENCWLFVKIEESANLGTYIDYEVAAGWTALDGVDGVYYRENVAEGAEFSVLAGDKVVVLDTVDEDDMTAAETTAPTLTFTAYAIQYANVATAADAWTALNA